MNKLLLALGVALGVLFFAAYPIAVIYFFRVLVPGMGQ